MSSGLLSDWKVLSPAIIAASACVFVALERAFPYDRGQRLFRKGFFNDFVLYTLVQSYALGLIIDAVIRSLDGAIGGESARLRVVSGWPVFAQLLFFFVVHDLYIYWFHRLQHWSPVLWRTHEAHHSVDDVDWLAGSRSHPIEILINQTVEFAPIVILGAAPEVALMKATLDAVWGMYIHANLDVRSGPLQYVINGPEMHRWHHSGVYRGYGFNFGTKLAIWDWLFGTAYRPAGEKPPCYGLKDTEFPESYFAQIAYAFRAPRAPSQMSAGERAPEPPRGWGSRLLDRLVALQATRPWRVLAATGVVTALSLALAGRLTLLTGFEHLLPEARPSVAELHRVAGKTAGISTLFIVLRSGTEADGPAGPEVKQALRSAGDALVVELGKLGAPWVGSVEDGVHEARSFLAPRAGLYVDRAKLEELRDEVNARFEREVAKRIGATLDDDEAPLPPLDERALASRLGVDRSELDRFPDGYYQSNDGRTLVVAIRSKVLGGDLERGTEALRRVREAIDRTSLASFHPSIKAGLAGDLYSGVAEVTAIQKDLTEVGATGLALIAAVVMLYYLRLRTLALMLATIVVGLAWTFGFTAVAVGHLNMATGFLFTIVAGNGINSGIIYMARYLEARRDGVSLPEGLSIAHRDTWLATLTACAAAGAAYASLLVTEFRGFRDFGLIGAAGMLICWVSTYWTMPALIAVFERISPLDPPAGGLFARLRRGWGGAFGRPIAALVARAPAAIAAIGVALAAAGVLAMVGYLRSDPIEYDMQNLRNNLTSRAEESRNKELADEITGYVGSDAMAILVDRPEQVPLLREALTARRDAAPKGQAPFKDLHALADFVPADQASKIPILLEIKDKLTRAHRRGVIDDGAWRAASELLPPGDLQPFTMADLPATVARPFTEIDGTRGRIVYISPSGNTEDARYLFRWADAYRETPLRDGSTVLGSGRAVIYADMWTAVIEAIPPATFCSLLATVLVVVLAFRGGRASFAVIGALFVGLSWLALLLVALRIKLNFLNFIALPITFGIGVDYAVNIVHRCELEGADGALKALRETGGAVILCSLTTMLGYLALLGSLNAAVRSLGVVAVLGEICCVGAAALVLPAVLVLSARRGREPAPEGAVSAPR